MKRIDPDATCAALKAFLEAHEAFNRRFGVFQRRQPLGAGGGECRLMPDLEETFRLLKAVVAAGDKEHAANSNEARAAAQVEALAARDALDRATGIGDLRRRRMIAEARGLPLGAKVDAAGFEQWLSIALAELPAAKSSSDTLRIGQDGQHSTAQNPKRAFRGHQRPVPEIRAAR